jgi:hypothetical protein
MRLLFILLVILILVIKYKEGGAQLAASYLVFLVGVAIAAILFRIAITIWRADPQIWERNRSIIRATRLFNKAARHGTQPSVSLTSLESEDLVRVNFGYSKRHNRFVPHARITGRALFASLRVRR